MGAIETVQGLKKQAESVDFDRLFRKGVRRETENSDEFLILGIALPAGTQPGLLDRLARREICLEAVIPNLKPDKIRLRGKARQPCSPAGIRVEPGVIEPAVPGQPLEFDSRATLSFQLPAKSPLANRQFSEVESDRIELIPADPATFPISKNPPNARHAFVE
jgi:hypothetical protein